MELNYSVDTIGTYKAVILAFLILMIITIGAALFVKVCSLYKEDYNWRIVKASMLSTLVVVGICVISIGICAHQISSIQYEGKKQIIECFENKGYEILDERAVVVNDNDYAMHEVYIIEDNGDVVKMAYRIGRCNCYFFIYNIVGNEYIDIT